MKVSLENVLLFALLFFFLVKSQNDNEDSIGIPFAYKVTGTKLPSLASTNHLNASELTLEEPNIHQGLDNIYFCKPSLPVYCETETGDARIVRVSVSLTSGKIQNRWYLESRVSNNRTYFRVYGVIESDPFPNLKLDLPWKRIGINANTNDPSVTISALSPLVVETESWDSISSKIFSLLVYRLNVVAFDPSKDIVIKDTLQYNIDIATRLQRGSLESTRIAYVFPLLACERLALLEKDIATRNCYNEIEFAITMDSKSMLIKKLSLHRWIYLLLSLEPKSMLFLDKKCGSSSDVLACNLAAISHILYGRLFDFKVLINQTNILEPDAVSALFSTIKRFRSMYMSSMDSLDELFIRLQHTVSTFTKTPSFLDCSKKRDCGQLIQNYLSLISQTMSYGAVELASIQFRGLLDVILQESSSSWTRADDSPDILFNRETDRPELHAAENILSLFRDRSYLNVIVTDSDLFTQALSILTQSCNPVILSGNSSQWSREVSLLRGILCEAISILSVACSGGGNRSYCVLHQGDFSSLVRGLFLEAYQGLALQDMNQYDAKHWENLPRCYSDGGVAYYLSALLQNISHFRSQDVLNDDKKDLHEKKADRVRVGFVCNSLSRHSVGRLLAPVVKYLSSSPSIELFILTDSPYPNSIVHMDSSQSQLREQDDIFDSFTGFVTADHWIVLTGIQTSDSSPVMRHILSLKFDVAVYSDLLMQSNLYTWAKDIRIARKQVVFWGHPHTTGFGDTFDYFISSRYFDSEPIAHTVFHNRDYFEQEETNMKSTVGDKDRSVSWESRSRVFSEQLVRFDSLSFTLFPAEKVSDYLPQTKNKVAVKSPKLDCDYMISSLHQERCVFIQWLLHESASVFGGSAASSNLWNSLVNRHGNVSKVVENVRLYGCLQSLMKLHPLFDVALLNILREDEDAIILLSSNSKQIVWQRQFRNRLIEHKLNINSILERIVLVPALKHTFYSGIICKVDVVLDPFPFGGGVTLCDAIAGDCRHRRYVPVVTSGKLQSVHRIGKGLASMIRDERVILDIDPYLEKSLLADNFPRDRITTLEAWAEIYAIKAVSVAKRAVANRINNSIHTELIGITDRVKFVIYNDTSASIEWLDFLLYISRQ